MSKFLFTDGSGTILETESREELNALARDAAYPDKLRVWIFNSNEWISYPAFCRKYPESTAEAKTMVSIRAAKTPRMETGKKWLKKFLFAFLVTAVALLIFNFTSARWEKAAALSTIAGRPGNVPIMDIDSLISQIELDRGKLLDRSTRTNLRLRNTWPERILLQLHAERESGNPGSRVLDPEISIDNTTGFPLDSAVVEIRVWKNDGIHDRDTIQFNNIGVDKLTVRRLGKTFRGDSLSVGFRSIRARAFNFCYSSGMENNSGNFNDRWFCRD